MEPAGLFGYERMITQDDMVAFIKLEFGRIGAGSHITPREVIRDFIELLDIVYQNPQINISQFILSEDMPSSETAGENVEEEFAEFEI